jgi:uncharacterized phage protein (TIGR01671 family)
MREIKFRAWDMINRVMIIPSEFDSNQPLMTWLGGNVYQDGVLHPYDMMQWTGLQDKNGNDIYELDVVKNNSHIFTVRWHDSLASYGSLRKNNARQLEVIGNFYETH